MDETSDLQTISDIIIEHIIPPLKRGLKGSAERHQLTLEDGSDNMSFGTDAWSLPARLIRERLKEGDLSLKISSRSGCVMLYGQYEIRHHRVGTSLNDDIRTSFPNGAKAVCDELGGEQFSFGFADTISPYEKHVVLAYMANPNEGLCAAYLAIPARIENGKIVAWDTVIELYRRDAEPDSFQNGIRSDVPPAEKSPDAKPTWNKEKFRRNTGENDQEKPS